MTIEEKRVCVLKGIEYLNNTYPGWLERIDLNKLKVGSFINCPLAQASGIVFLRAARNLKHLECWERGFGDEHQEFEEFDVVWKEEITKLKEQQK